MSSLNDSWCCAKNDRKIKLMMGGFNFACCIISDTDFSVVGTKQVESDHPDESCVGTKNPP